MSTVVDRLRAIASGPPAPRVTGEWFSIGLCPNLGSDEVLSIGVAYVDSARHVIESRLIDQDRKIRMLLGDAAADELAYTLELLQASFAREIRRSPSPNIVFSEPRFVAGNDANEILGRLFQATVSLSGGDSAPIASREKKDLGFNNRDVRSKVYESLRRTAGISAERIIAEQPIYFVKDGDKQYPLDIPLRSASHLGSIVSAAFRTVQAIESNLLRATVDLETARRVFGGDHLGLFVMRPAADPVNFAATHLNQIDNVIDMIGWKLHRQGVRVEVDNRPELLAQSIAEWAAL